MLKAIEAVKGGMSLLRAATTYDVPRTTLQDRVKGWVKHGDKPGPSTYLTSAEEEELEAFLMEVAKVGYGKTRRGEVDSWSSGKREGGFAGLEDIRWLASSFFGEKTQP